MKKALILILIFTAANAGIWFIYLPYQDGRLAAEAASYKKLRDERANLGFSSFEDIFRVKDKLGEFEKKLRTKKDFPKLITYLFERSGVSRIDISGVTYNFEEKKELALTKLSLNLTLTGRYENIRQFIYGMESGTHLFEIGGVKMSRQGDDISASMILTTYLKANP